MKDGAFFCDMKETRALLCGPLIGEVFRFGISEIWAFRPGWGQGFIGRAEGPESWVQD